MMHINLIRAVPSPAISACPITGTWVTCRTESKVQSCPENRRSLDLLHERAIPELEFPAVDPTPIVPKLRMLRRVIERLPQRLEIWNGEAQSTVYVERLECGHKLTRYQFIDPERRLPARRRHCVECARLAETAVPSPVAVSVPRLYQDCLKKPASSEKSKKRGVA